MQSARSIAAAESPKDARGVLPVMSIFAASLALAACNPAAPPPVAAAPVPLAAPEPPAPGVVGSAVGRELDEKDKAAAVAAQQAAISSGAPKTWKGGHGAYGFITPGPENGAAGCRDYTHKIYINGRPQEAKGQACKSGDSWRVTS
jgi:surface antigen